MVLRHSNVIVVLFVLVPTFVTTTSVKAQREAREVHVEATIPRYGNVMRVGYDSVWIKTFDKITRVSLSNNSITDIPVAGFQTAPGGWFGGMAVGAGAIWLPDPNAIYRIDAQTNQAVKRMAGDMRGEIEFGEGAVWPSPALARLS
jgi:hypothetical protein